MKILHTKIYLEKIKEEHDFHMPEESVKKGKVIQCGEGSHKDGVFFKPEIKEGTIVWYKYGEEFEGNVLVDYSNIIAHE